MNGSQPRILLVGFGNMGRALARGWLARGHPARAIRVVDPSESARAAAVRMGLKADSEPASVSDEDFDVVLLAVKPDQLTSGAAAYRALAGGRCVFLSIAAGKTIETLQAVVGSAAAVVRAMPNTPAAIGRGMTVLCPNAAVGDAQRALCGALMSAVGAVEWVEDEAAMDAVTALSGSGPAYVFLLVESMTGAAVELGIAPDLAARLATETVAGAAEYARQGEVDAAELRRRVTSPNGTTQAALDILMTEPGLGELMQRAMRAAAERSRELAVP